MTKEHGGGTSPFPSVQCSHPFTFPGQNATSGTEFLGVFGYLFCSGYLFSALTVWSKRLPAERAEKYLGCANMNKPG